MKLWKLGQDTSSLIRKKTIKDKFILFQKTSKMMSKFSGHFQATELQFFKHTRRC